MNNKIKILIGEVSVIKRGKSTKEGKTWEWILSKISAKDLSTGEKRYFATFDDFSDKIGQEVEVEVKKEIKEKDGKTYENYTISIPKRNIWAELDSLEERIARLEKLEKNTQSAELDEGMVEPPMPDSIKEEELNF